MDELYDMVHDPYEMQNVIGRLEAGEVLPELQSQLEQLSKKKSTNGR